MEFDWNHEKNEKLKASRNISFERIIIAIEEGNAKDILIHPNAGKFGNQHYILVEIDDYIWVVPALINGNKVFLKTAFPSRKYTSLYLKR